MDPRPRPEVKKQQIEKRPQFGRGLLELLEPTVLPFKENPKTREFADGIDRTILMMGDVFFATPRPSGSEQEITARLAQEARSEGWYAEVDSYLNVGMVIPATPGYEHLAPMLGHFHTDMVAAMGKDAKTNPQTDPIKPEVVDIDGKQYIKAEDDTALGSDDAAGAAALIQAARDIANEKDPQGHPIPHGHILLYGTSREEIGLKGMEDFERENTFDPQGLFAQQLARLNMGRVLNSDGEKEARITVGSLGGEQFHGSLPVTYAPLPEGYEYVTVKLDGFSGGHSGQHAGDPSAIAELGKLTQAVSMDGVLIGSIATRNQYDNSLPQNAELLIAAAPERHAQVLQDVLKYGAKLQKQYADPITISLEIPASAPEKVMDASSSANTLALLQGLSNLQGIASTSEIFGDQLLDAALSTGVLRSDENAVTFMSMARVRDPKFFGHYGKLLDNLAKATGMTYEQDTTIPIWEPNFANQPAWDQAAAVYEETFGKKPALEFAPGGTELGIFARMYPNLVIVGNGAMIEGAHEAGERVLAQSIPELYIWDRLIFRQWRDELLKEAQEELPARRAA